jgi:protein-S-isoprenylcysteine O-methyltransferase Ste14
MKDARVIASPLPLLMVIAAIVVLGVTGNLLSRSPVVIAVQVAAVALNIWARISFRRGTFRVTAEPGAPALITSGPFRFIRHPMYSAALLLIWSGVLSHLSALTVVIGVAVTAICVYRVVVEEQLLRATFPEYVDYARSTNALLPFVY